MKIKSRQPLHLPPYRLPSPYSESGFIYPGGPNDSYPWARRPARADGTDRYPICWTFDSFLPYMQNREGDFSANPKCVRRPAQDRVQARHPLGINRSVIFDQRFMLNSLHHSPDLATLVSLIGAGALDDLHIQLFCDARVNDNRNLVNTPADFAVPFHGVVIRDGPIPTSGIDGNNIHVGITDAAQFVGGEVLAIGGTGFGFSTTWFQVTAGDGSDHTLPGTLLQTAANFAAMSQRCRRFRCVQYFPDALTWGSDPGVIPNYGAVVGGIDSWMSTTGIDVYKKVLPLDFRPLNTFTGYTAATFQYSLSDIATEIKNFFGI